MSKKIEYTLTFSEALDILMKDEGWIQGDDFADGVIYKLGKDGIVKCVNFFVDSKDREYNAMLTSGIYRQKYRIVHTQPDAQRSKRIYQ